MFSGNCENCGTPIIHENSVKLGGTYWITTSGKWFCTNRCKSQYVARNNPNDTAIPTATQQGYNSVGSTGITEHDVELQRLKDQKEKEELEARLAKGQKLRDKNRPFAAWLIELDPVYSAGIGMVIFCTFYVAPVLSILAIVGMSGVLIYEGFRKS